MNGQKPIYMPLELKTGRASFSSEHTGQLIIYQMMLSEIRNDPVDSGLLLYLREGVMRQVKGSRNEKRDLIILRNELAYYLSREENSFENLSKFFRNGISSTDLNTKIEELSLKPELPEPISHHSACQNCPYQTLCSMYLKNDEKTMNALSQNNALRKIAPEVTAHLTDAHVAYFCRWTGILALEDHEVRQGNQVKNLWLETADKRASKGRAIVGLKLTNKVKKEADDAFIHEFQSDAVDLTSKSFNVGEYLIVSTTERLAVAAGRVQSIDCHSITICVERNLCERYAGNSFIFDKYESQTVSSFNLANLGALLDANDGAERLRR